MEQVQDIYFASSFFMTGLIWIVQLVHYPSFKYVDPKEYTSFQLFHMKAITVVVMPVMLIELFTILILSYSHLNLFNLINLGLLALIWLNTFFWNVPLHQKLIQKKDQFLIKKLVISNWPRTFIWSVKSLYLLFFA